MRLVSALLQALAITASAATAHAADDGDRALVEHGRYLVQTAGCNDCHTPGYAAAGGRVSEKDWLTGDRVGWSGPWGTTYATNLRLYMMQHSEASWLRTARTFTPRPPMPWFNVHAMSDRDLVALYRYIRYIGPAGDSVPAYVPPDQTPTGPVVRFPS